MIQLLEIAEYETMHLDLVVFVTESSNSTWCVLASYSGRCGGGKDGLFPHAHKISRAARACAYMSIVN